MGALSYRQCHRMYGTSQVVFGERRPDTVGMRKKRCGGMRAPYGKDDERHELNIQFGR